jgi:hypothetical protein
MFNPKPGQSIQTGPSAADERTNLPYRPSRIAILKSGPNLKIESHGMSPWLSSFSEGNVLPLSAMDRHFYS